MERTTRRLAGVLAAWKRKMDRLYKAEVRKQGSRGDWGEGRPPRMVMEETHFGEPPRLDLRVHHTLGAPN